MKILDLEEIKFYKDTFDLVKMLGDENYYETLYKKILQYSTKRRQTVDITLQEVKNLILQTDNLTQIFSKDELTNNVNKILQILLWPVLNDEDFNEKAYKDYNINKDTLMGYLYTELANINSNENYKNLVDFKFEKNKLKYMYFELEAGIVHVYNNNRLEKIRFCNGEEIKIPKKL